MTKLYTFNEITKSETLTIEREDFYDFVKVATKCGGKLPSMRMETWVNWLTAFYSQGSPTSQILDSQDAAN